MYLGEKLKDSDENIYNMVGIFKGTSEMKSSLKWFGYCDGIAKEDTILYNKGVIIKRNKSPCRSVYSRLPGFRSKKTGTTS